MEYKKAEIACTLSHRKCYRYLLESCFESALILEDNVQIKGWKILDNPDLEKYIIKKTFNYSIIWLVLV